MLKYPIKEILFFLVLPLTACGQPNASSTQEEIATIPAHTVDEVIQNQSSYDQKEIRITGYIRAGFDGYHSICEIRASNDEQELPEGIWVNNETCYVRDKSAYREGYGTVQGIFVKEEDPIFLAGDFYAGQMKFAEIIWNQ